MDNGNLNSNKVQEQISLYLDNALEPDQKKEFIDRIQMNPSLSQAVEKEKHFRSMIRTKIGRPKLGADFIQIIKNKIH